jgi:uncharacterized protein
LVIVADTGAIVGLIDADDAHHAPLVALYQADPDGWILPWAILPEVDYLLATHVGRRAQERFLEDLEDAAFRVDRGQDADFARARELDRRYRALKLGLVDTIVMATSERLGADAIATVDLRHFGAVTLNGRPRLLPRDA